MYKKKLIQSLALGITLLYGCTKTSIPNIDCTRPTSDINIARQIAIGRWTWAYERFYDRIAQTVITKTPATEGKNRQYQFQVNGLVNIIQNDTLLRTESYEITTLNIVTGTETDSGKTILLFKNRQTMQRTDFVQFTICNDSLTLNYDTYSHTRGREKWSRL